MEFLDKLAEKAFSILAHSADIEESNAFTSSKSVTFEFEINGEAYSLVLEEFKNLDAVEDWADNADPEAIAEVMLRMVDEGETYVEMDMEVDYAD